MGFRSLLRMGRSSVKKSLLRNLSRLAVSALIASGLVSAASSPASAAGDLGWDSEVDYAVDFKASAYALADAKQVIPATGDFTIEAWVRPTSFRNFSHIIDQGIASSTHTYLKIDANGTVVFGYYPGISGELGCGKVQQNAWNHLAVTMSGSTVRCFIDAQEKNTTVLSNKGSLGTGFRVGAYRDPSGNYSHHPSAEVDQVKVWEGALSRDEIESSMHALGAEKFDGSNVADLETLRAHYDFNEGSGTTIFDRAGANPLSLTVAATPTAAPSFRDVKRKELNGAKTYIAFPRTYLPGKKGWVPPAGVAKVDALIVAGGGGGGAWIGGGGGAGGFSEQTQTLTPGATVQVLVGQGGAGAQFQDLDGDSPDHTNANLVVYNTNGQASQFGSTAVPGGGAGGFFLRSDTVVAQPGGSGGGAIPSFGNLSYAQEGAGIAGFGNAGGAGVDSSLQPHATGGGGGAGGAIVGLGPDYRDANASGNGGLGKQPTLVTLTDTLATSLGVGDSTVEAGVYFASGGGGSLHGDGVTTNYSGAQGLIGGGGDGTVVNGAWPSSITAQSGLSNTGGGGGGAGNLNTKISIGGNGGSGVVVLSYLIAPEISSVTAGIASLTVNWADQGGASSGITAYRVDYADASAYEAAFAIDPTVSPSWLTASSTIPASETSYTVTNLDPDKKWFVRLAAVTAGGVGEFAYPWEEIFATINPIRVGGQIQYSSTLGLSDNGTDLTRSDFSRVRYRLEATYGGTDWYADSHFDKALSNENSDATVEKYDDLYMLQVPVPTGGTNSQFQIHGTVSDLSVQSNSPLVQNGSNLTGRLEIWPWNYSAGAPGGLVGGLLSDTLYDDGDSFATSGNLGDHGSFQLHNIGPSAGVVFAWNNPRTAPEIGFGSQPYTGLSRWHPDWTFSSEADSTLYPARTNFSYQAFANLAHQPLDDYSLTLAGFSSVGAKTGSAANPIFVIPEDANYTWEAWIKPQSRWTSGTSYQTILDNAEEGNNYGRSWLYLIDTGSGPFLSGGYYEEGTDGAGVGAPVGHLQYGKWQHVAMSVDRGSTDGTCSTSITGELTIRLFVNGLEVNSGGDSTFNGCLNSAGLAIGQNGDFVSNGDETQFFKGQIDQVKVWDGALTSSAIWASMNSFSSSDASLRAHYSFNDLQATSASGQVVQNVANPGTYDLALTGKVTGDVASNSSRQPNSFDVSFSGNSATSGSVASMTGYRPFNNLIAPSEGNLIKTSEAFTHWNSSAGGSGRSYPTGSNVLVTYGNQTLYAQWEKYSATLLGDTYVQAGAADTSHGDQTALLIKTGPGGALAGITRYGFVKFERQSGVNWSGADLQLTVSSSDPGGDAAELDWYESGDNSFVFDVYAAEDAGTSWAETLTFNQATAAGEDWAMSGTYPHTFPSATLVGTISIPTSATTVGQTYSLSSTALDTFLNAATSDVVFIIKRQDVQGSANFSFASSENGSLTGPRLENGSPSYVVTYKSGSQITEGDQTQTKNHGTDLTLAGSASAQSWFPRASYLVTGWTETDGAAEDFAFDSTYNTDAPLILYPVWGAGRASASPSLSYGSPTYSPSGTINPTLNNNGHDGTAVFSSTTTGKCTVDSSTGVATIVEAGSCSITMNLPQTLSYEAATTVATFSIAKANQAALTWDQTQTSYDHLGTLDLSGLVAGGSGTGTLSYTTSGVCTVTGTVLSGGNAGSSCSVTVTKGGDVNYNPISLTQSITINKINQSALAIANPGTVTFGDTIQLNTTGGSGTGAITFNSTSTSICTETSTEGEFEFVGVGDCVVSVSKAADTNYNSQSGSRTITSVKATHTLSFTSTVPANPVVTGTYTVTGVSSTAEASLAPTFTIAAGSSSICSIAGNVVTFNLDGTCEIEANKGATTNYEAAQTVTQRIVVGQANQSITFASLSGKTFGDAAFTVTATASSGNTVTFSAGSGTTNSACSVTSAGLVVVSAVGTCEIVADSASGNGYAAASPVARSFEVAPDTAGAPFITAVSFGDGQLTATYFAPSYVGGGTISGYRLQAFDGSTLAGTATNCATSGTLSCTVTGLTNGTSYTLKVAAITEAGVGAVSPASGAKIPAANPEAVTNLTAVQGDTKLTITWQAPTNLGGGTLDSFRVFHREAGGSYPASYLNLTAVQAAAATTNGVTEIEITGLTNGQAYDVKVITVTTANTAQLSSNTAEVSQTPYSVPDAPLSVDVLEVGDDIVITWSQPVFDGGSAISGYSVLLDSVAASCTATSTTSCTIPKSSLTPGATVSIDVKAENDAGLSTPTSTTFTVAQVNSGPSLTLTPGAPLEGPGAGLEAVSGQSWIWTKRLSKNEVKVYIKFPEMGARYQINLQKNDGDFVRKMSKTINSTSDTDLRVVGEWYYLVRTITLPGEGRYRIEVTQDGQRVTLNGADRPAVYTYK